jgi:hypothetical protein
MRSDDAKYDPPPVDLGTNLNVDLVYEVSKLVNKSLRIDAVQYSRALLYCNHVCLPPTTRCVSYANSTLIVR